MLIESFSGIRGIYGESLTNEVAEKYALCYFAFLKKRYKKPKIIIGKDTRPSSEILKNTVIEAVNTDIIDIGTAGTPAVEFAVRHFKADGGIIITASHNEPYYNGFKFLNKDGSILKKKDMESIIKIYRQNKKLPLDKLLKKLKISAKRKEVFDKSKEIKRAYSDFVLNFVSKDKAIIKKAGIKVLIDPNGGTGINAKEILERIGVKVIAINMDYGIFNRKVEPDFKSLFYLGNIVREKKAEFGAGFDCDADRLQLILPNNRLVSGHYLLAMITNEMLKEGARKIVITNNATSGIVREVAEKNNAKIIEVEVGETNVVTEMDKNRAKIGGEGSSGGVIISPSKCRDGILTLLMVIKIIAKHKASLQKIIGDYPKYYTETKNIKTETDPEKIKKELEEYYSSKKAKIVKLNEEGGSIKVIISKNSFVWFRDSKTEPGVFRIIADSKYEEKTEKLLREAIDIFNRSK